MERSTKVAYSGADLTRHMDYGYDTVNQLTSAVSTETPPAVNQSWGYDLMGNRTQSQRWRVYLTKVF